jgi:hypothetical protein
MDPSYNLGTFIHECDVGKSVRVINPALETAPADFGLHTEEAIVSFVAHGVESPVFINSTPLRWTTSAGAPVVNVDAYSFYSNTTYGYLAFFYVAPRDLWFIKSFKKNREPDPRFHTMRRALQKGGF